MSSEAVKNWETSWEGLGGKDFFSLKKQRYVWPFEGFIVSVARLYRAGKVALEKPVLDFGCGHGRHAVFLAKSGFESVSGLDISEEAVGVARKWAAAETLPIDYSVYEGKTMPYDDDTFGLVCCFGTFHHVPWDDQPALAREVARVVAPGGHLLWAELNPRTNAIRRGDQTGPNTFVINQPGDPEHGMIQHLLPLSRMKALFSGFEIQVGVSEFVQGEGFDRTASLWNLVVTKPALP